MSRTEIARKFDEIVDFSGVEKFIDTPVKRYSSGMTVRLAFAVAAHLEPEILVIDEVLAVGDASFQKKCLGKMSAVAREGRTILFVSHQAAAVENLCTRGILLESGVLRFDGVQTEAIGRYVESFNQEGIGLPQRTDRRGNGHIRIVAIELRDAETGRPVAQARAGQDVDVCLHFENHSLGIPRPALVITLYIATALDMPVFAQDNLLTGDSFGAELPERGAFVCRLRRLPLPSSAYRMSYVISSQPRGGTLIDAIDGAADLHVEGGDFFGTGKLPPVETGVALVDAGWRMEPDFRPAASAPAASVAHTP